MHDESTKSLRSELEQAQREKQEKVKKKEVTIQQITIQAYADVCTCTRILYLYAHLCKTLLLNQFRIGYS